MNEDDDEYNENMMRAFYEEELDVPPLTPKELRLLRNHWEKGFRRAKKIFWTESETGEPVFKLQYTESINFEI